MKKAVITGVLGQDGSYLAEYLLDIGYEVHGVYRRISTGTRYDNVNQIQSHENLTLHEGSITDYPFIADLITNVRPEEWYNLGAMSHVGNSFRIPADTFRINAEAVIAQLDLLRTIAPHVKFYQASTSELYGGVDCPKEGYDENSPFNPRSPYAVAKQAAFFSVKNYREGHRMFACNGILFNHSSVRRGLDFATRKISKGVSAVVKGKLPYVEMGSMEAFRDEGCAKDYVKAMHLMLQQERPDDYVVSMGEGASIKEMLEYVCELAGLRYDQVYRMNKSFMRPSDVPYLLGNPAKIMEIGWKPTYTWRSLLKEMFEYDLEEYNRHE